MSERKQKSKLKKESSNSERIVISHGAHYTFLEEAEECGGINCSSVDGLNEFYNEGEEFYLYELNPNCGTKYKLKSKVVLEKVK